MAHQVLTFTVKVVVGKIEDQNNAKRRAKRIEKALIDAAYDAALRAASSVSSVSAVLTSTTEEK